MPLIKFFDHLKKYAYGNIGKKKNKNVVTDSHFFTEIGGTFLLLKHLRYFAGMSGNKSNGTRSAQTRAVVA